MNTEETLNHLIENAGRMKSTDVQLLLLDRYEHLHGLHDFEGDPNPFDPILMNEGEDWVRGGAIDERMDQYIKKGIKDLFGLSFNEFIDQPTYRVHLMLKKAVEYEHLRSNALTNALKGLESGTPGTS